MAILIGGRAYHKMILETFDVITPDFALTEIDRYSQVITTKSRLTWAEHTEYAYFVFSKVMVIPAYLLEPDAIEKANQLIGATDPKDISYLALAIQTELVLVTRDKPIVEVARRKAFRRIMLYDEFLRRYA